MWSFGHVPLAPFIKPIGDSIMVPLGTSEISPTQVWVMGHIKSGSLAVSTLKTPIAEIIVKIYGTAT